MIESMKKKHSILFLAVALLASNSANAVAAVNSFATPELVVTATRSDRELDKVPAYIQVITADDIEQSGASSVPQILSTLPTVHTSNKNRDVIDMGGFGESANRHVVVLVDGRKVNPIDMAGPLWSAIPVDNIAKIEVMSGGSSVLYGDQAIGGVINIITKKPEDGFAGNLDVSGGTHDTKNVRGSLNFGGDSSSLVVGGSYYDTDGYREHSEEEKGSVFARARFSPSENLLVSLDVSHAYNNYNLPGSLTLEEMLVDRTQVQPDRQSCYPDYGCFTITGSANDDSSDRLTQYGVGAEYDLKGAGKLYMDASYIREVRDADMVSWQGTGAYQDAEIKTKQLSPKYVLEKTVFGHQNRLTLGADVMVVDYNKTVGDFEGNPDTWYLQDRNSTGWFLSNEFNLTENLLLSTGYRYEVLSQDLDGSVVENTDEQEWAGEIGLVYNLQPGSKVYAKVNRSFRFPVVDEVITWDKFTPCDPEVSVGYEFGYQYSGVDKLVVNGRGFLVNMDDEIMYNEVTRINENMAKTRHFGGDIDLAYRVLPAMMLLGGGSYTSAEFTATEFDGNTIPLVPEWKGRLGAEYDFGKGLLGRILYNYVGEQYSSGDYGNEFEKLDAYQTVDLSVNYQMKNIILYMNAVNIFNEEYVTFASTDPSNESYYPMPKAQYTLGMRMKF